MRLGVLINTDRHGAHAVGLARAALSEGHRVTLFFMDDGVRLMSLPEFEDIYKLEGLEAAYCELNANQRGIEKASIPTPGPKRGSQYDNLKMVQSSDRLVVL